MGLISLALILGYYLYFTEHAGAFLVRYFLSKKIVAEEIEIEKISGTIFKGMVLKNVTIRNAEEISFPHIFRIQDLNIHFRFLRNPISLRIENARLFLADEDPIVFSGTYHNGEMDFNLYAWEMDFAPLVQWIGIKEIFFQKIRGYLKDITLHIHGKRAEPQVEGNFIIEKFVAKNFSLESLLVRLDLMIKEIRKNPQLKGQVLIGEGNLLFRNSQINILESRLIYEENPRNPALFINGLSVIDKINIKLSVRGFFKDPKIELQSYPPLSQDRLLMMLATNKSWRSLEKSIGDVHKNEISSDMVKDFFDYAFLGGSGEKMAQDLGIKDAWIKMNQNTRSIGIKKSFSDELDVGYEVQETKNLDKTKDVKYKVLGDVKVTDAITVSVEKELKNNNQPSELEEQNKNIADDKVLIKYERRF